MDNNRILLKLDQVLRTINHDEIKPVLPDLDFAKINPVVSMVSRARAAYLKALFDLADEVKEGLPTEQQTATLQQHRKTYEELVNAAKAMEVAIERGYLDIQNS